MDGNVSYMRTARESETNAWSEGALRLADSTSHVRSASRAPLVDRLARLAANYLALLRLLKCNAFLNGNGKAEVSHGQVGT
jgi:hypothetical protein